MKKIILMVLLISCSKITKNLEFKNKDIDEKLVLAIINNKTNKAIELIKKGANVNYIHNNKSVLELSLNNKNLYIVGALLGKKSRIK